MSGRARILIITGPGKGKTTAACGIVLRSAAAGKKVLLARFAKARRSGELDILETLPGVTVIAGSKGMTPPRGHPEYPAHAAAAQEIFRRVRELTPDADTAVLDEVCGVIAKGLLAEEEVTEYLGTLRADQAAVLTGRGAGPGLIAAADTVSEITEIKHAYRRGISAQEGIEF